SAVVCRGVRVLNEDLRQSRERIIEIPHEIRRGLADRLILFREHGRRPKERQANKERASQNDHTYPAVARSKASSGTSSQWSHCAIYFGLFTGCQALHFYRRTTGEWFSKPSLSGGSGWLRSVILTCGAGAQGGKLVLLLFSTHAAAADEPRDEPCTSRRRRPR